jgi:hypothetical protein
MNDHSLKTISIGILAAAAFTAVIGLTAANLARFQIVGAAVPFAYPWRLVQPNAITELTGILTSELVLSLIGNTRIRAYGSLNLQDSAGNTGKLHLERNGNLTVGVGDLSENYSLCEIKNVR